MGDVILEMGSSSDGEMVNGINDDHPIVVIPDGAPPPPTMQMVKKQHKKVKPKPRASVLEYKTVNEMYDALYL